MKLKTSILLATSLALAAGAQAATIAWTTSGLTGPSDVRPTTVNETSLIAHVPVAASAVTVNGVAFSTATTGGGVTMAVNWPAIVSGTDANSQLGTNVATIGGSAEYKDLLEGTRWTFTGSPITPPTITISFSGLTMNQKYELRVWAADYRSFGINRYVSVNGGTTNVDYNATDTANTTTGGGFFTGVFTADATTQSFTLTGYKTGQQNDAAAQYNALQLSAIPEPGSALLGGLGILALLRRRR
jgi:hypothetical protein